jgi:hypothetical protein
MKVEKKIAVIKKANEIIKLFIENEIPISQQLEIIKLVREKLEFCRKTGAEIKQLNLNLDFDKN